MGYRLNRLDEPVLIALSKSLLTEFGIHHRLESCGPFGQTQKLFDRISILISTMTFEKNSYELELTLFS